MEKVAFGVWMAKMGGWGVARSYWGSSSSESIFQNTWGRKVVSKFHSCY